jgi:hypothetical protein
MNTRELLVGAGFLILVGLFLAEIYGWPAGASLIEQGLMVLVIARIC